MTELSLPAPLARHGQLASLDTLAGIPEEDSQAFVEPQPS